MKKEKIQNALEQISVIVVFFLALTMVTSFIIAFVQVSKQPHCEAYPLCGVVVAIDKETDTITIEDGNGNLWEFSEAEDWMIGDTAAMVMNDNGTPDSIYDDTIDSIRYCGQILQGWDR